MISKFDAFYGGHVEIEDFGFQGIPVDDRWLSDKHLSTALDLSLIHISEPTRPY